MEIDIGEASYLLVTILVMLHLIATIYEIVILDANLPDGLMHIYLNVLALYGLYKLADNGVPSYKFGFKVGE